MKAKYVNPFTDFGFKKIFGEEASKPVLMDFLNSLLPPQAQITTLSFKNTEQLGMGENDKKAIFDIYCENQAGEKFIVELQKARQNYFKERTIYYSTFPIRQQAEKGEWNYNLKAVFCIGILDFRFNDYGSEAERHEVVHEIKLKNQAGKVFYDKLTYIYLEMPNFDKREDQLSSRLDKWLYFIKHLEDFQSIPQIFRDETVFTDAFRTAELSKLDEREQDSYEYSLKVYRDLKGVIDTARAEGEAKGEAKGRAEGEAKGRAEGELAAKQKMAQILKESGVDITLISEATGLTKNEIANL